jgi:hypothetical protein
MSLIVSPSCIARNPAKLGKRAEHLIELVSRAGGHASGHGRQAGTRLNISYYRFPGLPRTAAHRRRCASAIRACRALLGPHTARHDGGFVIRSL